MEEKEKEKEKKPLIEIDSIYSNSVKFFWSTDDFTMMFGLLMPDLNAEDYEESKKEDSVKSGWVRIQNKVIMSPTHFKRFAKIANTMVKDYEKKHGTIPTKEK